MDRPLSDALHSIVYFYLRNFLTVSSAISTLFSVQQFTMPSRFGGFRLLDVVVLVHKVDAVHF